MNRDLIEAIEKNDIDMVRNIKLTNQVVDAQKSFITAIDKGYTEIVRLLLKDRRFDPYANNYEAIQLASNQYSYKYTEIVKLLLNDKRVDPSANNNEAIRHASGIGNTEIVKLLLKDKRVDPSANNNEALRSGIGLIIPYTETVKLLLEDERVDPSANNNEAIRHACLRGYIEIVRLLLKHPLVDPSANNNEAFKNAFRNDYHEIVPFILKDPRVRNKLKLNFEPFEAKWSQDINFDDIIYMNSTIPSFKILLKRYLIYMPNLGDNDPELIQFKKDLVEVIVNKLVYYGLYKISYNISSNDSLLKINNLISYAKEKYDFILQDKLDEFIKSSTVRTIQFFHSCSLDVASKIWEEGTMRAGKSGSVGPGVYGCFRPLDTLIKYIHRGDTDSDGNYNTVIIECSYYLNLNKHSCFVASENSSTSPGRIPEEDECPYTEPIIFINANTGPELCIKTDSSKTSFEINIENMYLIKNNPYKNGMPSSYNTMTRDEDFKKCNELISSSVKYEYDSKKPFPFTNNPGKKVELIDKMKLCPIYQTCDRTDIFHNMIFQHKTNTYNESKKHPEKLSDKFSYFDYLSSVDNHGYLGRPRSKKLIKNKKQKKSSKKRRIKSSKKRRIKS